MVAMAGAERMAIEFVRARHPHEDVSVTRSELRSPDHWTVWGQVVKKRPLVESASSWIAEIQDERVVSCDFEVGAGLLPG